MKKCIISIIAIFLLSIIISCSILRVQAVGIDALDNPDSYKNSTEDNSKLIDIGNIIVGVVRTIGSAISIVMLIIIGIKYIMASVEEKAEYKQTMWPYIVGAILIFAGSNLTNIIYNTFQT